MIIKCWQGCKESNFSYTGGENVKLYNHSGKLVQFNSVAQSCPNFATPWTAACQASLSITNTEACSNSCSLSQWYHSTISYSVDPFSSCLQSFLASLSFQMSQFFTSDGQSIGASACLISFRIDWHDLLAVQRTLKSLLQHHNLEASILQCSAFFIVQHSHPYMIIGKKPLLWLEGPFLAK